MTIKVRFRNYYADFFSEHIESPYLLLEVSGARVADLPSDQICAAFKETCDDIYGEWSGVHPFDLAATTAMAVRDTWEVTIPRIPIPASALRQGLVRSRSQLLYEYRSNVKNCGDLQRVVDEFQILLRRKFGGDRPEAPKGGRQPERPPAPEPHARPAPAPVGGPSRLTSPSAVDAPRDVRPPPYSNPRAASLLPCPSCKRGIEIGTSKCTFCARPVHPRAEACRDCDTQNLLRAVESTTDCRSCGAAISLLAVTGQMANQRDFADLVEKIAGYSRFEKKRGPLSGEVIYSFMLDGVEADVWQVPRSTTSRAPVASTQAELGIPDQVVLPSHSFDQGDARYLVYVDPAAPLPPDREHPDVLARDLFDLIARIHAAGWCVPALTPDDLARLPPWPDGTRGRLRLRNGHRLHRIGERFLAAYSTRFAAPELLDGPPSATSDAFTAARVWYWLVTRGVLGNCAQLSQQSYPLPHCFGEGVPPRLWIDLLASMSPDPHQRPARLRPPVIATAVQYQKGLATDIGRKPDGKQDDRAGFAPRKIVVVADGVTSAGFGHRAAAVVVEAFTAEVQVELSPADAAAELRARLNTANRRIGEAILGLEGAEAASQREDPMSSTVVAAYLGADHVTVLSLGDSRAYLASGDDFVRLTEDQDQRWESMVREDGRLLIEKAMTQEGWEHLVRYVGDFPSADDGGVDLGRPRDLGPDCQLISFVPQPGDRLLLCTDGVYKFLDHARLQELLSTDDGAPRIADAIVAAAVAGQPDHGDNATAVVVKVRAAESAGGGARREEEAAS